MCQRPPAMRPDVSIVIPTRNRARYLDVALASLAVQDPRVEHEVVVIDDASEDDTASVAERHGARVVRQPAQRGLNAGRNAGIRHTSAPLVAFLDDDIRASPQW